MACVPTWTPCRHVHVTPRRSPNPPLPHAATTPTQTQIVLRNITILPDGRVGPRDRMKLEAFFRQARYAKLAEETNETLTKRSRGGGSRREDLEVQFPVPGVWVPYGQQPPLGLPLAATAGEAAADAPAPDAPAAATTSTEAPGAPSASSSPSRSSPRRRQQQQQQQPPTAAAAAAEAKETGGKAGSEREEGKVEPLLPLRPLTPPSPSSSSSSSSPPSPASSPSRGGEREGPSGPGAAAAAALRVGIDMRTATSPSLAAAASSAAAAAGGQGGASSSSSSTPEREEEEEGRAAKRARPAAGGEEREQEQGQGGEGLAAGAAAAPAAGAGAGGGALGPISAALPPQQQQPQQPQQPQLAPGQVPPGVEAAAKAATATAIARGPEEAVSLRIVACQMGMDFFKLAIAQRKAQYEGIADADTKAMGVWACTTLAQHVDDVSSSVRLLGVAFFVLFCFLLAGPRLTNPLHFHPVPPPVFFQSKRNRLSELIM